MKGRQQRILFQCFVSLLFVLVVAHESRGILSHLLHQFPNQSEQHPISRVLLSLVTPDSANAEARLSEESFISPSFPPHESPIEETISSSGPVISAVHPPSGATTPTYSRKDDNATVPASPTVPEGTVQSPPTISTTSKVLPPSVYELVPAVQPSSPSGHVTPVSESPRSSQYFPPAAPDGPAHTGAGAPEAVLRAKAPESSSPVTLPNAQGPVVPHAGDGSHYNGTPTATPTESSVHPPPTVQPQPKGFAVSPTSVNTSAGNGTRSTEPVPAPQNNYPSPHNSLEPKGSNSSPPLANPPSIHKSQHKIPSAPSPQIFSYIGNHSNENGPAASPIIYTPPPSYGEKNGSPVAAPPNEFPGSLVPPAPVNAPAVDNRYGGPVPAHSTRPSVPLSPESNPTRTNVTSPAISPVPPGPASPSDHTSSPPSYGKANAGKVSHAPSPAPAVHQEPARRKGPAQAPSHPISSEPPRPALSPRNRHKNHPPVTDAPGPSAPSYAEDGQGAPTPSLDNRVTHNKTKGRGQVHFLPPVSPPSASLSDHQSAPKLQPIHALPPPPPNQDCVPLLCTEPLTNSAPGSPCDCVLPINVGIRLSISLYTFFPLVSELAKEIAFGVLMQQSHVRIMGADADSESIDQTIVLFDLLPKETNFSLSTAFMIYHKLWNKQVVLDRSRFGDYTVLYVRYPGLPGSPPMAPGNINGGESGIDPTTVHPLAVDVGHQKGKRNVGVIAIVVLSAVIALFLCFGCLWILFLKYRGHFQVPTSTMKTSQPPLAGTGPTLSGGRHESESASFASSIAPYTGSAKTFSLAEMERATNRFGESRTIGEGGFGRVYEGTLDDGTRVAIKVLKRDDRQGSREFLAEVEMLSRLHHRNLIKLIGICTESHIRCLVYELLPNGSVESHLHGADKETAPLDWNARLKIALGAARGLAYLHEDSSPRVIHRDFKSSNILLEEDFTPKVSDFGLARTAMGEGHEYISTRVMGTFGYVAPEYAMTGHLLVKSDVYSYGVVLLELLTGRKPVDMLRPPGQESLVTWARPYLTSKEGLEAIIDPSLGTDIPHDCVAKVAAIASMCVQPEVDQRPFMGEVVQALKLVCNDGDDYKESELYNQENLPAHDDKVISISMGWESESENVLSASDIFNTSTGFTKDISGSFRRYSSSGPLRPGSKSQTSHTLSKGSISDHGKFGKGLDTTEPWP